MLLFFLFVWNCDPLLCNITPLPTYDAKKGLEPSPCLLKWAGLDGMSLLDMWLNDSLSKEVADFGKGGLGGVDSPAELRHSKTILKVL